LETKSFQKECKYTTLYDIFHQKSMDLACGHEIIENHGVKRDFHPVNGAIEQ
jgi:hypothetical protein